MKISYSNGYKDGSGKGTIVENIDGKEEAILRTHWGCSCCDSGITSEQGILADKVVKLLNKNKKELRRGSGEGMKE